MHSENYLQSRNNLLYGDLQHMHYMTSAAIITAVKIETESVHRLYDRWEKIILPDDKQEYYSAAFIRNGREHKIITAQQNTMGMTAAAHLSSKLINFFRPEYLIMCGIAACLGPESEYIYGDVIVPDIVWDYSAGKFTTPGKSAITFGNLGFQPYPNFIALDDSVLEIVKSLKGHTEFELLIGPMGCGSAVIANREAIETRINSVMPDTLGVDMESYGVFYAAENSSQPRPKAIVIKSICDYADSEKSDKYQKFAAYTSSEFMKRLLENHLPFADS